MEEGLPPARTVPQEYQDIIPETQGLVWEDDFFDDEQGIIAVFDMDYEAMNDFHTSVAFAEQWWCSLFWSIVGGFIGALVALSVKGLFIGVLCGILFHVIINPPCLLKENIRWMVYSHHLAVSRDGIRYVTNRRRNCWGLPMCDVGKNCKTIPFDKITDCDLIEPAGACCCCITRVLYTLVIDTGSSGSERNRHELELQGIKNPTSFKNLVWAVKRNSRLLTALSPTTATLVGQQEQMSSSPGLWEGVDGLLREIRDELRENNALLRQVPRPRSDLMVDEEVPPSTEYSHNEPTFVVPVAPVMPSMEPHGSPSSQYIV